MADVQVGTDGGAEAEDPALACEDGKTRLERAGRVLGRSSQSGADGNTRVEMHALSVAICLFGVLLRPPACILNAEVEIEFRGI